MNLRISKSSDIESLKHCWKLCFGDDDADIDLFFSHRYRPERAMVAEQCGRLIGMLFMIEHKLLQSTGKGVPAVMLYAVGTHPDARGQGVGTALLEHTQKYLKSMGVQVITLVPAESGLFDFYRKRGYETAFTVREFSYRFECEASDAPIKVENASASLYACVRELRLEGTWHAGFSKGWIDYQKRVSLHTGCDLLCFDTECGQACAAVERMSKNRVSIKELLTHPDCERAVLQQIGRLYQVESARVRTPVFAHKNEQRAFGMQMCLSNRESLSVAPDAYLGFAFD